MPRIRKPGIGIGSESEGTELGMVATGIRIGLGGLSYSPVTHHSYQCLTTATAGQLLVPFVNITKGVKVEL